MQISLVVIATLMPSVRTPAFAELTNAKKLDVTGVIVLLAASKAVPRTVMTLIGSADCTVAKALPA